MRLPANELPQLILPSRSTFEAVSVPFDVMELFGKFQVIPEEETLKIVVFPLLIVKDPFVMVQEAKTALVALMVPFELMELFVLFHTVPDLLVWKIMLLLLS